MQWTGREREVAVETTGDLTRIIFFYLLFPLYRLSLRRIVLAVGFVP